MAQAYRIALKRERVPLNQLAFSACVSRKGLARVLWAQMFPLVQSKLPTSKMILKQIARAIPAIVGTGFVSGIALKQRDRAFQAIQPSLETL